MAFGQEWGVQNGAPLRAISSKK